MNPEGGLISFSTIMSPPSKAIVYERHGSSDSVTRVVELPPVEVREDDVCVRMIAAPINPADINQIEGLYPVRPSVPAIGGQEGVGQVYTVGSSVKSLSPGDWVIPSPLSSESLRRLGTWQTYVVKEESEWHRIDKRCPIEYAATITVNPLTALRMLEDFVDLNPGDSVVQNGATSIVGQCVIQLARLRGISSINIIRDRAGSDEAKEKLEALGADKVFLESQLNVKNFKSLLGNLAEPTLGFNCVGGNGASVILKTLREGGTMVTYGAMSKKPITVSATSLIFKDLSLRGFWLQRWINLEKAEECRKMVDYLIGLARDGELKYEQTPNANEGRTFGLRLNLTELVPFEDFAAALDKALGKQGSHPKQVLRF